MKGSPDTRARLLEAAERLFGEHGYAAVTVKDIAHAVGIHHASLYHHSPGGKEELFVEVTERGLMRHQRGMNAALARSEGSLRAQLRAIADWLLSQAPVDLVRMALSDMPQINTAAAETISNLAHDALLVPIMSALEAGQARGEINYPDLGNVAGSIFASIEALHTIPAIYLTKTRLEMAYDLIDIFIRGMQPE